MKTAIATLELENLVEKMKEAWQRWSWANPEYEGVAWLEYQSAKERVAVYVAEQKRLGR